MTLANRGGCGPQISTSSTARLLLPLLRRFTALALVIGVAPRVLAADCAGRDGSRTCLATPGEEAGEPSVGSALLQVSKPHKAMEKAALPVSDEHTSRKATKQDEPAAAVAKSPKGKQGALATAASTHSDHRQSASRRPAAAPAASHDVRHHSRHVGHTAAAASAKSGNALSFIQTAESVLEQASVVDGGSDDESFSLGEEVHGVAWWRRAVNVVLLVTLASALAWGLCWSSSGFGRPFLLKFKRLSQVGLAKNSELPKPEDDSTIAGGFKEALLPQAASSYSIPLTHHTEVANSKVLSFNIPRNPEGPPVSAMVTCRPDGSTWANVQLFAGEAGGGTPLASCRLVHSTADVESRNIQGAMMSWLSLLLDEKADEKEGAEAADVETMAPDDPERVGPPQQSRMRTCLHGIAEDLIAAGTAGGSEGKDSGMRLEVRDSLGSFAGTLNFLEPGPASKPGRYALMRQGKTIFDIEAKHDGRSIVLSRQGEDMALATYLGTRRSPEPPEVVPEEEDHLQVDIRDGLDRSEAALLLTCALAMVVFKPKDRKECLNVEDVKSEIEICKLSSKLAMKADDVEKCQIDREDPEACGSRYD